MLPPMIHIVVDGDGRTESRPPTNDTVHKNAGLVDFNILSLHVS